MLDMDRIIGFFVCLLAVLMPWRLRVIFSEIMGWLVQSFYFTFYGILNYILKELKKAESERQEKEKP
jgi:hypothetical protein